MVPPVPSVPPVLPDVPDADAVTALRDDLEAASYRVDAADALLGPVAVAALHREQSLPAQRVLDALGGHDGYGGSPLAVLIDLFLLARPVRRGLVDAALPRCGTAGLQALGLVSAAGAGAADPVRAVVDVRPYAAQTPDGSHDWWLVSDLGEVSTGAPLRPDHVLGIGPAGTTLAQATIRRPVARVLDLGTGSGLQALHARTHASHVVGTDVSRRALAMARLTLALSAVQAVELRHGNLFDPVAGERFDQVASNPPFVITPRLAGVPAFEYRDGGLTGHEVVRRLVTGVGAHLEPGGVAQLLGNWEVGRDGGWTDVVGAWVDASGLDAWVVQRDVQDPAEYAELWARDGSQPAGTQRDRLYRAWLDDFERRGVEEVGFGVVTLRRPGPGTVALRRLESCSGPVRAHLGAHLDRCLAAHDRTAGLDDRALLDLSPVVAPDVTEERHHRPGEEDPAVVLLRQGDGFARTVQVGTATAAAVGACDGELTLGRITGALAVLLERPVGEVETEVVPGVRALIADGLLLPGA